MSEHQQLLTLDEAAQRLAVSRSTVKRLVAFSQLPVVRLRGCVRVRPGDIAKLARGWDLQPVEGPEAGYQRAVDEYGKELMTLGRATQYVKIACQRLGAMGRECGWAKVGDVTQAGFERWRQGESKRLGPRTLNHYLRTLAGFLRWLVSRDVLERSPLKSVRIVREAGRERAPRRAFSDSELSALLGVMEVQHQRACLMAVLTGLRRTEIETLTWADIVLDERPFVRVRAENAKNAKVQPVPIPEQMAEELRQAQEEAQGYRVFETPKRYKFHGYLRKAGVERVTRDGRVDFHAFRHTYCTNLHRAGVPLHLAQRLMRHSDVRLTTQVYSDEGKLPMTEAAAMLPRVQFDLSGTNREPANGLSAGSSGRIRKGAGLCKGFISCS
jgi:excisionase family DNA binding protein